MAATWTTQRERSNMVALSMLVWVALRLGRRVARLFLYPITFYFVVASQAARAASRDYLRRVLGREATLIDGFRHVFCFAASTLDRVFLLNDRTDLFDLRVTGRDIIGHESFGRGGAFVIGAHLGSFEAVRAAGQRERALPVSMVMYEDNAQQINRILAAINPRLAQSIIPLGRIDSMLRVKRALDDGGLIGMLADRTLGENGQREAVRRVMLLGAPVTIPLGPFRMAAMLKRPVIFMVGLYGGGNRYDVHYEVLADFSGTATPAGPERAAAIDAAIDRYAGRLEHFCRIAPYNWFNFYAYWDETSNDG